MLSTLKCFFNGMKHIVKTFKTFSPTIFEMDWLSLLVGAVVGVFTTIFAYEYNRWRERMTEAWESFRETKEMQVGPGLSNFQNRLGDMARSLQNIASNSETIIPKKVFDETVIIAGELAKLSQTRFYINGGHSWNTFLERGDKLIERCKELKQRLV